MRSRFAYAAILALTFALLVPSAAVAAEKQISLDVAAARVAAVNQLIALNIDPATAVFQIGSRNYAGVGCPGSGWNCSAASIVVQIATGAALSNTNMFKQCSASACVILQTNTTGDNSATCQQWSSASTANQTCEIRQNNGSGRNTGVVGQLIDQRQGTPQTGMQRTTLRQSNVSGQNWALIGQAIQQQVQGKITDQEATQNVDVCQGGGKSYDETTLAPLEDACTVPSGTGSNFVGIGQALTQQATARPGGVISQTQQGTASGATATILQKSTSGKVDSVLRQPHSSLAQIGGERDGDDDSHSSQAQLSTAAVIPSSTQTQGNGSSGLHGTINQVSTGVATSDTRQDEIQTLRAPMGAVQTQNGPEFCCSTQATNTSDTDKIVQRTVQTANAGANQHDSIQGDCNTSGNCTIDQQATQNGTTTSNACSGSVCIATITCGSEGPGCSFFSSNGGGIGMIAPVWTVDRRADL